ncbi:DUF2306 domain-containing protein [Gymnodinialimonas sp.]
MTFEPLATAPAAIQLHLVAAACAILIGPVALYRPRRDLLHKVLGRLWVVAMAVLAVSGLFIEASVLPLVGPFGPIHLFSVWALISLVQGMAAILRRDVAKHQAVMRALYWQALGIAGLLTLMPGRRLNAVLFDGTEERGLWVIAAVGLVAAVVIASRLRGRARGRAA